MNNMWGSMLQYNEIYWPWPIAIYLFLAGLSAGAMMVAIIQRWRDKNDACFKSASLLAPLSISIGLALLVFDLGKPFDFYWILLKYNFTSVMSIGVALLLFYTPLAFVYAVYAFRDVKFLAPLKSIINTIAKTRILNLLELLLFILAIGVGVYTGFLLSAVSKIVLWSNYILPILFLVSGFSSGVAASIFFGILSFKNDIDKSSIDTLLKLDLFAIFFEIALIVVLFMFVFSTSENAALFVKNALTTGGISAIFWVGVVGLGLLMPILIDLTALKGHTYKQGVIVFNTFLVLVGVILLRCYIVYAGQIFTGI
ncbi:polysulfide reductase [Campylobacter pinnipediorum subsp. pinnipediorum]|uniref:NrfD/PsrC family molybdoenzyme membrane anchor subunit n=1 Tax=Campylobacter pinnipediorum TaxID=1965231 RepID=UPI000995BD59|nr:NrfD/PsrC family molybdoenzyme membrane anchor subunit [Campylobacter pinnipediorum]OPA76521.1 polysulfide reductase [Campylobacter pinnipediorum subsp. pinnipediorum]